MIQHSMKKIFSWLLLCSAFFYCRPSIAQSRFYRLNQLEVDRAKAAIGKACRAYASSADIPEKKNKADKNVIAFLNDFYNHSLSVEEITKRITVFSGKKWQFTTTDLGNAVKYETQIRSDGNLRVSVSFTLFQHGIVFRKIYFETLTKTKCTDASPAYIDQADVNYLDVFCLPSIDFPISFRGQTGIVECDATSYEKLKNDELTAYKLPSADSLYINSMVWYDDDKYNLEKVDPRLLMLTNFHNTYMLYKLLYSPNQIVAVYAFEALTYLQAAGIAKHPDYIIQKMEEVQNSPVKIHLPDAGIAQAGTAYKDLRVSPEKIMAKYKEGLKQLQ